MTDYKVGDLASLMSSSGSKLQSLFDDHWNKRKPPRNAKKTKSQLIDSASKSDFKSHIDKKQKNKCSKNSSNMISFNGNTNEKSTKSKKMRKKSFSEKLSPENEKQDVESPHKAFIRCSKRKRQEASIGDFVVDDLLLCDTSDSFSHKLKKAKHSSQNYSSASEGDINVEQDNVKDNLFNEGRDSENRHKSNKLKNKKSKRQGSNFSNPLESTKPDCSKDIFKREDVIQNPFSNRLKKKKNSELLDRNSSNPLEGDDCAEDILNEEEVIQNPFNNKLRKKNKKKSKLLNRNSTNNASTGKHMGPEELQTKRAEKNRLQDLKDLPMTLFVGNLPISVTRKTLHKLFASFGTIKCCRLRGAVSTKLSIPKKVAEIKSEYHQGLKSHTGFVVFKDEDSAKKALSLNGTLIDGHHIVVDRARQAGGKKMYRNDSSVFIGNLPFDVGDETVRSAFEECGEIHAVRIIRDRNTGCGKGFGYIEFQKRESKERALSLQDLEINGRNIRIKPIASDPGRKTGSKETVMMIRNNMATRRTKESSNKKSVKKLLKRGKHMHERKQIARLFGEKFAK